MVFKAAKSNKPVAASNGAINTVYAREEGAFSDFCVPENVTRSPAVE